MVNEIRNLDRTTKVLYTENKKIMQQVKRWKGCKIISTYYYAPEFDGKSTDIERINYYIKKAKEGHFPLQPCGWDIVFPKQKIKKIKKLLLSKDNKS